MKIITLELAREVFTQGQHVISTPSPFYTPDKKRCESILIIHKQKFFVLTAVNISEKERLQLMKAGHIEITAKEAKESFGHCVDFYEIDESKLPKDFKHNIISPN